MPVVLQSRARNLSHSQGWDMSCLFAKCVPGRRTLPVTSKAATAVIDR